MYVGLDEGGTFDLFSTETTDVLVDIFGYFTPLPRTMFVQDPRTNTTEYRFDSQGRMVNRIDEDAFQHVYAYDDKGYLSAERDEAGLLRQLKYDQDGHLISERTAKVRQWPTPDFAEWESTSYFGAGFAGSSRYPQRAEHDLRVRPAESGDHGNRSRGDQPDHQPD
ncbi:MAG TPA: hypothetical protein VGJ86_20440 [Acidimicrobiales bacterium]|jgi:YD repeat-containing protein